MGPIAPVAPVAPAAPVSPLSPLGPIAPVAPVAPAAPVSPLSPLSPLGPVGPTRPLGSPIHLPVPSITWVVPMVTDLGVMSPVALPAVMALGTDTMLTRGDITWLPMVISIQRVLPSNTVGVSADAPPRSTVNTPLFTAREGWVSVHSGVPAVWASKMLKITETVPVTG